MRKEFAEFIGTLTLVLLACGTAVIAGDNVGYIGISFAFGLALIGMAYGIGAISGCHINPAVSLGAYIAGRMEKKDLVRYIIAQCAGATAGAFILYIIMLGKLDGYNSFESGLGNNGWGEGYLGEYGILSALVFELVATFLFVVVILGSTSQNGQAAIAGLAIGLTLVVIHLFGIPITGVSVNPARSLGPALFSGGTAIAQLPLFLIVPMVGGALAGGVFKAGLLGDQE